MLFHGLYCLILNLTQLAIEVSGVDVVVPHRRVLSSFGCVFCFVFMCLALPSMMSILNMPRIILRWSVVLQLSCDCFASVHCLLLQLPCCYSACWYCWLHCAVFVVS